MKYLIEITADCNDDDNIVSNYVGTDADFVDIKKVKQFLKMFQNKLTAVYKKSTLVKHGQTIDAVEDCLYALVGNHYDGNKEFLEFVKQNQNDAEFLISWIHKYWPGVNTMISYCHTLVSIKAYKLSDPNPLILYAGCDY
jgi:hypothetical protein